MEKILTGRGICSTESYIKRLTLYELYVCVLSLVLHIHIAMRIAIKLNNVSIYMRFTLSPAVKIKILRRKQVFK